MLAKRVAFSPIMPPRRTSAATPARAVHFSADQPAPQESAAQCDLELSLALAAAADTQFDAAAAAAAEEFLSQNPGTPGTPNPFLSPSFGNGNQGAPPVSQGLEQIPIPGLFPAHGATPTSSTRSSDLPSATQTGEQTLLDGGNISAPPTTNNNAGLHPPIVTELTTAGAASMPSMPASSSDRDVASSSAPPSQSNVHIQSLDAGHIFDIVFTDLPSLAWLRPAWIDHDLNGRLLYRLQPPHLADVLVDLELASQRYITSRHQKLNIARAIYSLLVADDTSQPNDIAAWDRYSLTLPPINNILTVVASASQPIASSTPTPGTGSNPIVLISPPLNTNVPGERSMPIVLGDSLEATPGGTFQLETPSVSSAAPATRPCFTANDPLPIVRLFSPPPPARPTALVQPSPSSASTLVRTRSISAEVAGHQNLHVHDPNPLTNSGEVMMTLPCGTVIYRDRPAPIQVLHYPTLFSFEREAWEYFIVKYRRENLLAHKQNSILIIRRIDHGIVHEVCSRFNINPTEYHSVSNATMEQHFFTHFGPETPSVARDRFSEKQFKFDDQTQHQNQFASKLSRFLTEKAEMVLDFAHAELAKWNVKDEFTHQMYIEALIACFPSSPSSSNNDWIVRQIKDHRGKMGHEIAAILNDHFRAIDHNVARDQGSYHVFPTRAKFKSDRNRGDRTNDRTGYSRDGGNPRDSATRRRGDSRDGGAPFSSVQGYAKGVASTQERGICGNRQHTCSAETCLFWGEPEAKPANYAWGQDEKSVSVPRDRYLALISKKPHIVPPSKSYSYPPPPPRGSSIPHGFTNRGRDVQRGGGGRGRGSTPYRGAQSNPVKRNRYTSFDSVHTAATPAAHTHDEQHDSFYAVARIHRQHMARTGRCTRTLMDTGASGMNIIRSAIVDDFADSRAAIEVLSRRINCTDLTNNGKVIGRASEEVRITFTLDTLPGAEPTSYTEWFYMFDDLQDEMVLGSSFNRTHGFSTYHETLVEWQGAQCPQQTRHRDRITTPCERQSAAVNELRHSKIDVTACTKRPGTNTPIIRRPECHGVQHYPLPANVQGKTPGSSTIGFASARGT